jgi:cysteinyl-tRNA synthetase
MEEILKMKIYNTMTSKLEEFKPIKPDLVKLYTCGPTVYNYAHIGNYRAYVFEDLLKRTLKLLGFSVIHVMNITDIDDKTIKNSFEQGKSLNEYTEFYTNAFFEDLDLLHIDKADHYPRATEHIKEMIALIKKLEKNGLTYLKDGSVYFSISKYKKYGQLSKIDIDNVRSGARYDADEYEKDDVRDFVLWKGKKENEPYWSSPFGDGRPGWHIECSAMSMKYLGKTFDLHTGGVDNIFPHHENEIAQSEGATGKKFVNYWMHCEHLIVEGKKMSKSLGNFYTLRDLIDKGYSPLAIRYLLLSAHYRSKLNFTLKGLDDAEKTITKINDFNIRLNNAIEKHSGEKLELRCFYDEFLRCLSNDLNISGALAQFHEFMKQINTALNKNGISSESKKEAILLMEKFNSILSVLTFISIFFSLNGEMILPLIVYFPLLRLKLIFSNLAISLSYVIFPCTFFKLKFL